MDLIIQTLHFAGELVNGLDEILNDIVVGALLLRFAKEDLCLGGCLPHGDPNRVKLTGIHEASSNSCCKILTTGRLSPQSGTTRMPKMRDHLPKPGTFNQAPGLPERWSRLAALESNALTGVPCYVRLQPSPHGVATGQGR